uniref:Nicastrin n=1 Tax=Ditylenchus dipsaci TaxID=166011 RepID=A0A915ELQ4_9BILA
MSSSWDSTCFKHEFSFGWAIFLTRAVQCQRIKDQISVKLSNVNHHCFRMLNGSTAIGCQSERSGNMGAVYVVSQPADLERVISTLPLGISHIIAVIDVNDLSSSFVDKLKNSESVSGVLYYHNTTSSLPLDSFSEDSACPNHQFSYYNNSTKCREWNKEGALHPNGLKFLSWQKPVYFLNNRTEIEIIINKCHHPFNNANTNYRCMARMTQFMLADGKAEICMRRQSLGPQLCDALHDRNVFALLPPLSQESKKADIFLVSSRMDSFSTFTGSRGGDLSALTSVISLLAVAEAIGQNLGVFTQEANRNQRQLLLAFFHGESMGYIGSSRMLWDMSRQEFPAPAKNFTLPKSNIKQLNVDDISFNVELQQLQQSTDFYAHTDFNMYSKNKTIVDSLIGKANQLSVSSQRVPENSWICALSFGATYKSNHINSFMDSDVNDMWRNQPKQRQPYVDYLSAAANATLETVLQYVLVDSTQAVRAKFAVNETYVNDLMVCLFEYEKWDCPLFGTLLNTTNPARDFAYARNLYIGTTESSLIRILVQAMLVKSLGEKEPTSNVSTESQCRDLNKNQNVYNYVWQNDPKTNQTSCYQTSIYLTDAESPAFYISDYDFSSGQYSTWMESVWESNSQQFELYMKADYRLDLYALLTALVVMAACIPLKFLLKESWFMDTGSRQLLLNYSKHSYFGLFNEPQALNLVSAPLLKQIENFLYRSKESNVPLSSLDLEKYYAANLTVPENVDECYTAGLYMKKSNTDPEFSLVWTSPKLHNMQHQSSSVQVDSTYGLNWNGFFLMVAGFSDANNKFYLTHIALVSCYNISSIEYLANVIASDVLVPRYEKYTKRAKDIKLDKQTRIWIYKQLSFLQCAASTQEFVKESFDQLSREKPLATATGMKGLQTMSQPTTAWKAETV